MRRLLWLRTSTLILALGFLGQAQISNGADDLTWTGGGDGTSFDDTGNWVADFGGGPVPASPSFAFTEDSLKFNSAGTTVNNDLNPDDNGGTPVLLGLGAGTNTDSGAFHFQAGSGDFTFTGFPVNVGGTAGDTIVRAEVGAGMTQTFDLPISISGGNKNREIRLNNGGTAIFNGQVSFANSRLFANETAGRIELNGDNIGVGLNAFGATTAATTTNGGRMVFRNNVSGTVLGLGSDTALGDVGTGTWDAGDLQVRGLAANQILTIDTNAARDLSGYHFAVSNGSGGGGIRFNSAHDVSIGYVSRNGNGTRTVTVNNSGVLSIDGGIMPATDDQARDMTFFATGAGGSDGEIVVNGRLFNSIVDPISAATNGTAATGGIAPGLPGDAIPGKQITSVDGTPINGSVQFREGTHTLNGDSSMSWIGSQVIANVNAKVVMGHDNAFGDADSLVAINNNATIDLNGHTMVQRFNSTNNGLGGNGFDGQGAIINSNTSTPATLASDILSVGNFSVGGAGDLEIQNVSHAANVQRNLTKFGTGTVTLAGNAANSRYGLIVNGGTVRLNKVSDLGFAVNAVINNPLVINNGATVVIANGVEDDTNLGSNNQIHNGVSVNITDGTLDLAGNRESIGRLTGGSTSVVESNGAAFHGNADARIAIGEHNGAAAVGAALWEGTIQDGTHAISVSLNGGLEQTFSGTNTYSGETHVLSTLASSITPDPPSSTLVVEGSITNTSKVSVDNGAILSGNGTVVSPDWDIHGTVRPGSVTPTAAESLSIDFSAADSGSGESLLFQSDSTLSFVLDAGLASSSIDILGSSLSVVTLDDNAFDFTDLTVGDSLSNGDYTLFDGDANTTYNLGGGVTISGLDAYTSSSISVSGNDLILSISNEVAPLPGDFNADGTVDAADYTVYRDNLGSDSAALNGNGTGAPVVIAADYNLWVANYGSSNSVSTSAAVPEPTTVLLMAAGLALSGLRRRIA